jgi:subtilase family protein
MRCPRLVRALAAAALALLACIPGVAASERSLAVEATNREVLVMLRLPASHYRPDSSYFGSYTASAGRANRQQIAEELAARFGLRVIESWPMASLGVDCFVMEAPETVALEPLIERIALDTRVESVQAVNLFRALARDDPLYRLQPTATLWRLEELHRVATGRNVRVAAIDSGVEIDHPDLRGRVEIARNFVDAGDMVAELHGTAVAGIIGARADNGVGIVGVAPEARLMALRACWQAPDDANSAMCNSFTLAKALQFAIDHEARVINLSVGGPRDRLLERLLALAALRGAVIVAAANPRLADGGFPASVPGVVAVAADDATNAATMYRAPGSDIPTTLPGQRWGLVRGSSYAAAEVSGLVALLSELRTAHNARQIREALSASNESTSPRRGALIDACAAVARTLGSCACGCKAAPDASPVLAP